MTLRSALLAALLAPAALAQPGTLDPAFGEGGIAISPSGAFFDLAVTPDGRLIGVGFDRNNDPFVAAFRADGTLAATAMPLDPGAARPMLLDVVALPDGKMLVTGGTPDDEDGSFTSMFVVRLTPALAPDPTFGTGGFVYFDGAQAPALTNILFSGAPLAVDDEGAVYVAGRPADVPIILAVARLLPDGTPDTDYGFEGAGGLALIPFLEDEMGTPAPAGLAFDAAGRLVVGASLIASPLGQATAIVARFTSGGQPDASFGGDGAVVVVAPSGFNTVLDLAVTPAGPVVSGYSIGDAEESVAYALRLLESGAPDLAFGDRGFAFAAGPEGASLTLGGLVADASGRILLGAQSGSDDEGDALVFRFLPDGKPDLAFGVRGVVRFGVGGGGANPFSLVAQGDDVLAAGFAVPSSPEGVVGGFVARIRGAVSTASDPGPAPASFFVGQPYPNPTAGRVSLVLPPSAGPVSVEVIDALGRRVAQHSVEAGAPVDLDASALPSGAYVIRVRHGDELVTRRFVRI